jgi:hypothetical protein
VGWLGRLSSLRSDALVSFLRIIAIFLVPFLVALAGLALLTSLPTAVLWVGIIATLTYVYVRFNAKHNEHPEYDDHPPSETYTRGLESYLRLIEKDRAPREE